MQRSIDSPETYQHTKSAAIGRGTRGDGRLPEPPLCPEGVEEDVPPPLELDEALSYGPCRLFPCPLEDAE
jgi:hypothetical protein